MSLLAGRLSQAACLHGYLAIPKQGKGKVMEISRMVALDEGAEKFFQNFMKALEGASLYGDPKVRLDGSSGGTLLELIWKIGDE